MVLKNKFYKYLRQIFKRKSQIFTLMFERQVDCRIFSQLLAIVRIERDTDVFFVSPHVFLQIPNQLRS